MSLRSSLKPAASTFFHCAAVILMERCSNLSWEGFGGLPGGFFKGSIGPLSVIHKTLEKNILL